MGDEKGSREVSLHRDARASVRISSSEPGNQKVEEGHESPMAGEKVLEGLGWRGPCYV